MGCLPKGARVCLPPSLLSLRQQKANLRRGARVCPPPSTLPPKATEMKVYEARRAIVPCDTMLVTVAARKRLSLTPLSMVTIDAGDSPNGLRARVRAWRSRRSHCLHRKACLQCERRVKAVIRLAEPPLLLPRTRLAVNRCRRLCQSGRIAHTVVSPRN